MTKHTAQRAQLIENNPSDWVQKYDLFLTYVRTLQMVKLRFRDDEDHEKLVHISQKEIESRFFIYPKHDRKTALRYLVESGELEIKESTSTGGRKMFLYGVLKKGKTDLSLLNQPPPPDDPLFQFMANCLTDVSLRPGAASTPYFDFFLQNKESFLYHFFKVDVFAGRVHTPITNFHRHLRPNILLYGEKTVSFDVATMQPLLLGKILLNQIGENQYSDWINQGVDIYVKLQETANLSARDKAKKRFFEISFAKPSSYLADLFGASDWINWINYYKSIDEPRNTKKSEKKPHNNLAWLLQSTEVGIMRKVWNLLFYYKIPFLSVHDEIIIRETDRTKGEALFNSVLKNEFEYYKLNQKGEKTAEEQPSDWSQQIKELESYFNSIEYPQEPIKINSYSTILDCTQYVEAHFSIVKANNGKQTFLPYLNRLQELKKYFQ
jgi:hypothetical protein